MQAAQGAEPHGAEHADGHNQDDRKGYGPALVEGRKTEEDDQDGECVEGTCLRSRTLFLEA